MESKIYNVNYESLHKPYDYKVIVITNVSILKAKTDGHWFTVIHKYIILYVMYFHYKYCQRPLSFVVP